MWFKIAKLDKIYELIDLNIPEESNYIVLESLDYIKDNNNIKKDEKIQDSNYNNNSTHNNSNNSDGNKETNDKTNQNQILINEKNNYDDNHNNNNEQCWICYENFSNENNPLIRLFFHDLHFS